MRDLERSTLQDAKPTPQGQPKWVVSSQSTLELLLKLFQLFQLNHLSHTLGMNVQELVVY